MTTVKDKVKDEVEVSEMTQSQITAVLDHVNVGGKLKIWLFKDQKVYGQVMSKEPNTCPLRQITRINLEGGGFLERKKHSENDFTNWKYHDDKTIAIKELGIESVMMFAVTTEK